MEKGEKDGIVEIEIDEENRKNFVFLQTEIARLNQQATLIAQTIANMGGLKAPYTITPDCKKLVKVENGKE